MSRDRQQPGRQLGDEAIADLTIAGKFCPLPGSSLWEAGSLRRPKYVWADMSSPGQEPEIVREFNERNVRFSLRMAELRKARNDALYGKPDVPKRWPGIAGY